MKILTQDPKNYLTASMLENTRLGLLAKCIQRGDLENIPHGIVILGLADDAGVKNVGGRIGAADAPACVRAKLYKYHLEISTPLYDIGDLLPEKEISLTHQSAEKLIFEIHAAGHFPLLLGGGHDLAAPEALALLATYKTKHPGFLNLDAHLDLRDTKNGITSGSPWYLVSENKLFQKQKAELVEFGIQPHCNSGELIERAGAKKIRILWLAELRSNNLISVYKKELARLAKRKCVMVSLDIDGVRSSEAPGCSAPQVCGFHAEEAILMAEFAGKEKAVKSFGIYELSPPLDFNGQTTSLVAQCVLSFLRGYSNRRKILKNKVKS